jgi:molybdopterin-guanine dinucleotide biosynthesis protein A
MASVYLGENNDIDYTPVLPDGYAAVILSGGYSSRMHVNKAFLRLGGTPLIEIMLKKVAGFEEVLIVTNSHDEYSHLLKPGVRVVGDIFPHNGPLSGIHAALSFMDSHSAFVLPCDMPLLPAGVVRHMLSLADTHPSKDVFAPAEGELYQPLCAVYRKSCLPRIESNLKRGMFKLQDIYAGLDVHTVPIKDLERFGDPDTFFDNANDPHCFEKLRRIVERRVADSKSWDVAYPEESIV